MTQATDKIWQAGKIINAGQGENEFVSLLRPNLSTAPASPAAAPAATSDAYSLAQRPSHVLSTGDRPNNSVLSGNPLNRLRNA